MSIQSVVSSVGSAVYQLSFELSPIIFCGGIAANIPGGVLPIVAITEAVNFPLGLLSGSTSLNLDNFFAHFLPLPGSTLAENQIGAYPFANQGVAGNAIIAQPLTVSMLMICPTQNNYLAALGTMMALKAAMAQHDALGGTYTVITPKAFYQNCIRVRMVDASTAESKQPQNTYQIDFLQPLLTLQAAQAAQNSLMSKLTGGTQILGAPSFSGIASAIGLPSSLAGTSLPAGLGSIAPTIAPAGGLT